jgi:large subunit ribosomal protein L15
MPKKSKNIEVRPLTLSGLKPALRSRQKPTRIGRGTGSGLGKTAGKGHKGQLARSGGGKRPGFEGGQMPLTRRVPKRGFKNPFRREYAIVNLENLDRFDGKEPVTLDSLKARGLVPRSASAVKVLGEGNIKKALTIQAHKFSQSAVQKIQAQGGKAEVLGSV